jgi:hypothetical protein
MSQATGTACASLSSARKSRRKTGPVPALPAHKYRVPPHLPWDTVPDLELDKSTTALVVIDLQKGIAGRPTQPHTAQVVVKNAAKLVKAFRKNTIPVFLVHVVHARRRC